MKKLILTTMPLIWSLLVKAQTITPQVISNAGAHSSNANTQLTWTLGEPVTTTLSNGSNTLTQGFNQSSLTVTSLNNFSNNGFKVDVFPNPTSDVLKINTSEHEQVFELELLDLNGKKLMNDQLASYEKNTEINMTSVATGYYCLHIYNVKQGISLKYKISKN